MNLLAIETSTPFCSVAVARGDELFARHFEAGQRHAELALAAVDEVLREAALAVSDLSGVAFGEGPGSFTGLRIACGLVQGMALARSLPVVGIGTLAALAEEVQGERVVACLDARMGEIYHAAYVRDGADWRVASPPGVCRPENAPPLPGDGWTGCGSGFAAFGAVLAGRYAGQIARVRTKDAPSAAAVLRLARPLFERGAGRDAASAVPIYLRDKVAMTKHETAQAKERERSKVSGRRP